jgi:hypothetical protein
VLIVCSQNKRKCLSTKGQIAVLVASTLDDAQVALSEVEGRDSRDHEDASRRSAQDALAIVWAQDGSLRSPQEAGRAAGPVRRHERETGSYRAPAGARRPEIR